MLAALLAFTSAITGVLAAPTTTITSRSYTDSYDSPSQQAAAVLPVAASVNNTAGGALAYNAFVYSNVVVNASLTPPSAPDIITSGTVTQLRQGEPAWFPMNSSVLYFTQKSIYYACYAQDPAPIDVVTPCTIQLAGLRTDGTTVVQELVYSPSVLPLGQTFVKATFPSTFSKLVRMNVELISAPLGLTLVIPGFDNNAYTAYFKS